MPANAPILRPSVIAIGSTNPIKCGAAEAVLRPLYPEAQFVSLNGVSGVSAQPMTDAETRLGAINRARHAQQTTQADWGIGFEGGIAPTELGLFTVGWVAVADRSGTVGVGGSPSVRLPAAVVALLEQGLELGEAMDQLFATQDLSHREGAIGVFSGGLVTRQESFEFSLKLALAPFRAAEWY